MHKRYEELKRRCLRYRIKRVLQAVLFFLLALVGIAFGFYLAFSFLQSPATDTTKALKTPQQQPQKQQETLPREKREEPPVMQKRSPVKEQNTTAVKKRSAAKQESNTTAVPAPVIKRMRLEPVYNFKIDTLYEQSLPKKVQKKPSPEVKPKPKPKPQPKPEAEPPQPEQKEPRTSITEGMISSKRVTGLKEKIEIYEKNPHYDAALLIAKQYFKQREYKNSIIWLKRADKRKKSQEEVFNLYARALYFDGEKQKALNVIDYFLGLKQSDTLSALRSDIVNDRLKPAR